MFIQFIKTNSKILILLLVYILYISCLVGWRTDHVFLIVLCIGCYFAHPVTRNFITSFFAFVVYWVIYDSMRIVPNYMVNTVHIMQPYLAEKAWFGITHHGVRMTWNEFFGLHHTTWADISAGLFYINWVPVPILFAIYLLKKNKQDFLDFTYVFLLTNLVGFIGYYSYPAAPPWYVELYGNIAKFDIPGNVGRLARFDDFFGISLFHKMYSMNANVFAAIPSLHSAYPAILILFGLKNKNVLFTLLSFLFALGIWVSAVYLNHHYIIDVLLGILCAVIGFIVYFRLFRSNEILTNSEVFKHFKRN